jgi:hypothetical protein
VALLTGAWASCTHRISAGHPRARVASRLRALGSMARCSGSRPRHSVTSHTCCEPRIPQQLPRVHSSTLPASQVHLAARTARGLVQ